MAKTRVNRKMNPLSVKILDMLDSEWVPYEDVIEKMSPLVPGELAWRLAERQRGIPYRRAGIPVPPRTRNDNPTTIILIGQRTHIRGYLQELKRSGRIEVLYGESPTTYKRPTHVRLSVAELELRNASAR